VGGATGRAARRASSRAGGDGRRAATAARAARARARRGGQRRLRGPHRRRGPARSLQRVRGVRPAVARGGLRPARGGGGGLRRGAHGGPLMCGIAGWVGVRGGGRDVLDAMLRALEHRGPDDTGRYLDGQAALGMTRLSIIDLVTGRQPMSSDDGTATLVSNGEIYNFRDLRVELRARGRPFVPR